MDHLQARVSASGVRRITSAPTTVPHATINQDYANLGTVQLIYYYDLPCPSLNFTRALRSARLTQVTTILLRGCWKLCPTPCLLFPFSGLFWIQSSMLRTNIPPGKRESIIFRAYASVRKNRALRNRFLLMKPNCG
jgi:hypothetical protein